jgi:hypothetical protein
VVLLLLAVATLLGRRVGRTLDALRGEAERLAAAVGEGALSIAAIPGASTPSSAASSTA